jgi:hypothetical protein
MRIGDWKILATLDKVPPARGNDITEQTERDFKEAALKDFMLFNLKDDIAETKDLAGSQAARLAEMKALLEAKYAEVVAESPMWPAWKFTGAEGEEDRVAGLREEKESGAREETLSAASEKGR